MLSRPQHSLPFLVRPAPPSINKAPAPPACFSPPTRPTVSATPRGFLPPARGAGPSVRPSVPPSLPSSSLHLTNSGFSERERRQLIPRVKLGSWLLDCRRCRRLRRRGREGGLKGERPLRRGGAVPPPVWCEQAHRFLCPEFQKITSPQMCNFVWLFRVLWRILSVAF
ncbi:hypothetical protein BDA96_07G031300 [Sorghum bicolor]|uniref:Uncharacterized protein n=1 Tax=Sorghum bicolor TaxID=4558 RepID=A0A921U858_SORBI|nr:hypothetical protein BDA96_07G031300 [Sorghum bicolor]